MIKGSDEFKRALEENQTREAFDPEIGDQISTWTKPTAKSGCIEPCLVVGVNKEVITVELRYQGLLLSAEFSKCRPSQSQALAVDVIVPKNSLRRVPKAV